MKLLAPSHKFLIGSKVRTSSLQTKFWYSLSLIIAASFCLLALRQAFSSEYVTQDDARQHVFWMQRFSDPALFPNDLIADYFQSITPVGYSTLFWLMAKIGLDPLLFAKLLPIVLALIATSYYFSLCLELLPVPFAAFLACVLLNQNLWLVDDLVSSTPTAFIYPLLIAFLYYLLRRSLLPCLIAIALQGLFYPPSVFICAGILVLQLFSWKRWLPRFHQNRREYLFCAAGLAVAVLIMLPYALSTSNFGPVATAAQARKLPEFLPGTVTAVFVSNPIEFWFCYMRTGLLPTEWCSLSRHRALIPLMPPQIWAGLSLLILLSFPPRFSLVRRVNKHGIVLFAQVIIVSLGLFLVAHAVLFKLYLPSRYTEHSLRILLPIAAGIALAVILDAIFRWVKQPKIKLSFRLLWQLWGIYALLLILGWLSSDPAGKQRLVILLLLGSGIALSLLLHKRPQEQPSSQQLEKPPSLTRQLLALALIVLLGAALLLYPIFLRLNGSPFPKTGYIFGTEKPIYEFFAEQPKDILIASLSVEQTVLPTFSKRSVLLGGWVLAPPYHRGYYTQIAQRASDLLDAQYSPNLEDVQRTIQKYGIDFWLLDQGAFKLEYLLSLKGLRQFKPAITEAQRKLTQGVVPALTKVVEDCSVLETKKHIVLQADCIGELPNTDATHTVWASYPTDSPIVDFLRPPLPRLTSGQ